MVFENSDEIKVIQLLIDLLSKSTSVQDLCKRLMLAEFMHGNCQGVTAYILDKNSEIIEVASFGKSNAYSGTSHSIWDQSLLSKSLLSCKVESNYSKEQSLYVIPTKHADVVNGAFLINHSTNWHLGQLNNQLGSTFSVLLGLYMENQGLSRGIIRRTNAIEEEIALDFQELTSRQIRILDLISEGMTNAEIAKQVLLSESTVRQETIRIYRILKCHSRSEAIVKARANGIIAGVASAE